MFNSFHLQSECCPNYVILVPCFSFLPVCFHINFDPLSSCFMSFNLQGSRNVPCSPCWTECFKFCSPPLCHFLKLCDLSRFFGFTRLSKKQLCFTSSSFVFPTVPSEISGRDPLVAMECCDAPRPELQMPSLIFRVFIMWFVWFIAFIFASCALHHVFLHLFLKLN